MIAARGAVREAGLSEKVGRIGLVLHVFREFRELEGRGEGLTLQG